MIFCWGKEQSINQRIQGLEFGQFSVLFQSPTGKQKQ
ncbi:hypothetical protein pb186bvf_013144 [Paramecium bursaria]